MIVDDGQYHTVNGECANIIHSNLCVEAEATGDTVTLVSGGNHKNVVVSLRIGGITIEITGSFKKSMYTIPVEDLVNLPAGMDYGFDIDTNIRVKPASVTIPVTLGEGYYIEAAANCYYNESTETMELQAGRPSGTAT